MKKMVMYHVFAEIPILNRAFQLSCQSVVIDSTSEYNNFLEHCRSEIQRIWNIQCLSLKDINFININRL